MKDCSESVNVHHRARAMDQGTATELTRFSSGNEVQQMSIPRRGVESVTLFARAFWYSRSSSVRLMISSWCGGVQQRLVVMVALFVKVCLS